MDKSCNNEYHSDVMQVFGILFSILLGVLLLVSYVGLIVNAFDQEQEIQELKNRPITSDYVNKSLDTLQSRYDSLSEIVLE